MGLVGEVMDLPNQVSSNDDNVGVNTSFDHFGLGSGQAFAAEALEF